ncbi:MAG: conjugal transfer protein TraG [Pseudomonas sp. PGPPP4]|uniref:conjugal transfer protein TraG N-terminal domain-containing protein n=1 Tax=Pseudomonas sp. PGPPP4 TaxID=2015556 RepID=UPI000BD6F6D9|nr:conjugal transfer protein TraG N-terminal domain-containing protein [Pseudomonas sp. PGPPP4]OYT82098.1 MAG: conjugal transfer protein TraG [Pseudomonas sp. PGPPP4]
MVLYTNDYLEYYLTLVGWLINGAIWDLIGSTGLFAAPFAAIVIQEWLRARGEGQDEGNKGALSLARIENRFYVAIFVIMLGLMPLPNSVLSFSTLEYDKTRSKQCQVDVLKPSETGWGTSFSTLNGKSARIPIWWAVVHALSKGFTAGAVAGIPCGLDLQQLRIEVNATRIGNPLLAQEVADFTNDCYAQARAKLFMTQPNLSASQFEDVSWIGSKFFLSTSGYYSDGASGFRSHTPRKAWPYDTTRDAGLAETTGGGGYPTCSQWWSDGTIGLRARLLAAVEPNLITQLAKWAKLMNQQEVEDQVIRDLVSPRKQVLTQGQVYGDYGGQVGGSIGSSISRVTATAGQAVGSIAMYPAIDSVRQAAPMVLAFLKMAFIICIPIVLVLGTYDLKVAMTLTFAQFALIFVDFWLQLARWVDSTILDALYGNIMGASPHLNFNIMMGMNNAQGDLLLDFVMGTMFLVLPAFWITAMSWAGVKVGDLVMGLAKGTEPARSAGQTGGEVVTKAVGAK